MPLFLVRSKDRLLDLLVTVETKKKPMTLAQCYRCQRYGHTQSRYAYLVLCVKCAGSASFHALKEQIRSMFCVTNRGTLQIIEDAPKPRKEDNEDGDPELLQACTREGRSKSTNHSITAEVLALKKTIIECLAWIEALITKTTNLNC